MEDGGRQEPQQPEVLGQHRLQVYSKIVVAFPCDLHVVRADNPVGVVGALESEAGPLVRRGTTRPGYLQPYLTACVGAWRHTGRNTRISGSGFLLKLSLTSPKSHFGEFGIAYNPF